MTSRVFTATAFFGTIFNASILIIIWIPCHQNPKTAILSKSRRLVTEYVDVTYNFVTKELKAI
jgi:hypothetical protein